MIRIKEKVITYVLVLIFAVLSFQLPKRIERLGEYMMIKKNFTIEKILNN